MHDRPVVVFSGGGTGGHLYPALAIADALRELRPDVRAYFVGARRGIEGPILHARGEEHLLVPIQGVDRTAPFSSWKAIPALWVSFARVWRAFAELRPQVVVVTGGYAGMPAGLVAGLRGIPLVLQEQNSMPGLTTRVLTRWADRVHIAFPEATARLPMSMGPRVRLSGNPVRSASTASREAARGRFGLPTDALVVLVSGGSQGSLAINLRVTEVVQGVVAGTLERPASLHLLWATGPRHYDGVRSALSAAGSPDWVHAMPYIDDMPAALATADLAVGRAGAMSTAELLVQGLPAVLVPLPTSAADHQLLNARALTDAGAALLAEEHGLSGAGLWGMVLEIATDAAKRSSMAACARARGLPAASVDIATDVAGFLPAVQAAI